MLRTVGAPRQASLSKFDVGIGIKHNIYYLRHSMIVRDEHAQKRCGEDAHIRKHIVNVAPVGVDTLVVP